MSDTSRSTPRPAIAQANGDPLMTFRQLFSPSPSEATPGRLPAPVGYPFPPEFIEQLKRDLKTMQVGGGTAVGVQIGFESTRLSVFLLGHGIRFFAVESNDARRKAGERLVERWPSFHLSPGTPSDTGLETGSADFIVSDRALYWPDQEGVRQEFTRILRPGGVIALITDNRVYTGGDQAQEFEGILRECCPGFREKRETRDIGKAVAHLFAGGKVFEDAFTNAQHLALDEFLAQTAAMPIYPEADDPARAILVARLRRFFQRWEKKGRITIPTVCRVAFGRLNSTTDA